MCAEEKEDIILTFPIIIMRNGGLDGVALQAREYRYLLNKLDIGVYVMTGRCETKFHTEDPIGHKQLLVPRLDFYHKDSKLLFANQFEYGDEKDGVDEISEEKWHETFLRHKNKIRDKIDGVLKNIDHNTPVMVYNLISLRHAHPAAALAIYDLMIKYPNRPFLSHSADPDAERPEKINRIKKSVLPVISAEPYSEEYSGGPYNLPNLYHIVLNPTQRDNFINKYGIPKDKVFEIPDFLDFPSPEPAYFHYPKKLFLQFVSECCLKRTKSGYKYVSRNVDKNTVYFISPVRPVYRKCLKESMLVAQQYGKKYNKDVVYIVTHPDTDDKQYFLETIDFAEQIGLPYYHLGERFTLGSLDTVYENMAALTSVGVISSCAGGWENALNELARACIPFYMNNKLNSFIPLTKEIGVETHGTDFMMFTHFISELTPEHLKTSDLSFYPEMKMAIEWVKKVLENEEERKRIIEHNYKKAYAYLSYEATLPKLIDCIQHIYEQYGCPCDYKAKLEKFITKK
jgi:hypothetical protein